MTPENPPAFGHGDPVNGGHPGMTLRDWFAGQLAPVFAVEFAKGEKGIAAAKQGRLPEMTAEAAYMVADAMLAARKDGGVR